MALDHTLVPLRAAVERFDSDGECLTYNPRRDEATALNRSATEIWQLCDGTLTIAGIARVLATRYGVEWELLLSEVEEGLTALDASGLVTFSRDSALT
jgi:hypothetical protein